MKVEVAQTATFINKLEDSTKLNFTQDFLDSPDKE
jgi:hypothetical protein